MEQNNEPEALDVANQLEKGFITLGKTARALRYEAAEAIRHIHSRVQELEAMLEAVGAGGVSAQRITQAAQAPATAIQERDKFEQLMAASYPNLSFERHSYQYDHNRFEQYKVQWLWEGWQARAALDASDHIEQPLEIVAAQEPFGYFKAEPFGWRDCAETDEGAIALYEAPQPLEDARDAECFRFWVSEAARSPAAMAKLIMHCTTEDEYRAAITQCIDARKAAIAAAKENK